MREKAYAPYSKYKVGAALLTNDGKIFTGCNVENAAYGEAICAERTAVVKAVSEGHQNFVGIAVATENGASPCGSCRQVMNEFGSNLHVILVDGKNQTVEFALKDLLPNSFSPKDLKK